MIWNRVDAWSSKIIWIESIYSHDERINAWSSIRRRMRSSMRRRRFGLWEKVKQWIREYWGGKYPHCPPSTEYWGGLCTKSTGGGGSLWFENSDFKFNFSIISKLSINTFRYQVLQLITGLGWQLSSCFWLFYSIFFIFKTKSTAPPQYKKYCPLQYREYCPPQYRECWGRAVLSSIHWYM